MAQGSGFGRSPLPTARFRDEGSKNPHRPAPFHAPLCIAEREFFIDNLLVRIHFIIVLIRWTGLAPWQFEFPFPGNLTSTFLVGCDKCAPSPSSSCGACRCDPSKKYVYTQPPPKALTVAHDARSRYPISRCKRFTQEPPATRSA